MKTRFLAFLLLAAASGFAQQTARVVKYHANDIVSVRARSFTPGW